MAKIANVALTDTFDTWRTRSNQAFDRLSQFALNNSKLYANTIIANNVFKALGNTVIGAAGKRAIITGLLSANGRVTVGTNINISGNTALSTGSANTVVSVGGARLTNYSEFANTSINTGTAITVSTDTNVVRYLITNNTTITLPSGMPAAAPALKTIVLLLKQDGTGSHTVALAAPAGQSLVYNNSASMPPVNSGANKITVYTCMKFDGDANWYISQSFISA